MNRQWLCAGALAAIPMREGRAVRLGAWELAVFNLGGRVLAVANRCPHRGGPLCDGLLAGETVVCPLHAWKVLLNTGAVAGAGADACVATFPARVEDALVYVQVPEAGPS
jgi:nitrite reductase (NADH) small subunit